MAVATSKKIKTVLKLISEPKLLSALISLRDYGYLKDIGWINSFLSKKSIDINGKPIPWFTYPAIEFLKSRLTNNLIVLEFGSGNSTAFLSDRVQKVISIEHDSGWFKKVTLNKPENARIILTKSDTGKDYLNNIDLINDKIDVIIVDGLYRNGCIIKSLDKLSINGVIILDDSERIEYTEGKDFLSDKGFKKLEFWGVSPGYLYNKCTTIYYRNQNLLNI